uniref:ATP synthase complex subunit 8 n=1 Tax=Coridius chinensis TaxID=1028097 RepID=K7P8N2_CORCQ|nr:ATP synthase F0 subunit 8 [Coridius chinensis]
MPQMAPLWWETLYIMFTLSFFIVLIFMYHNINKFNMKSTKNDIICSQMNWKW